MPLAETLLISILSSVTVTALLVFLVRRYLGQQIDWQFKRRELAFEAELKRRQQIDAHFVDARLGIYPEISQLCYRIRKATNDGMERDHIAQWDDELPLMCSELTPALIRWRYYLPPALFTRLHDFKRAAQDVAGFHDVRTRPEQLADREAYLAGREALRPTVAELNRLHDAIIEGIALEQQGGAGV
ncbi:MAG: hypothetical protein KDH20_19455 [Rhodocyclaceae bacterium]|nr:hypothetical protein [Rhodocyclaceae bacterium]